jgi:hypothetical protein
VADGVAGQVDGGLLEPEDVDPLEEGSGELRPA